MQQVKFRPDQPLFKADALRFPLWLHLPMEVVRWLWQWHTGNLHRDNPHSNRMHNATLTQPAKRPHRLAFWTGREVTQQAKWRRIAARNLLSWGVIASLIEPGVRGAVWPWVGHVLADVLVWVGLTLTPWLWVHWLWLPLIVGGMVLGTVYTFKGLRLAFRRYNRWVWLGGWQRLWVSLWGVGHFDTGPLGDSRNHKGRCNLRCVYTKDFKFSYQSILHWLRGGY